MSRLKRFLTIWAMFFLAPAALFAVFGSLIWIGENVSGHLAGGIALVGTSGFLSWMLSDAPTIPQGGAGGRAER